MNARTSRWTTDLLVVLLLTVVATGTVLLDSGGSMLRTVLVAPILLFLPGYALIAAIYPERRKQSDARSPEKRTVAPSGVIDEGLQPSARIGLSVAASIAIVPAIVYVLNYTIGSIEAIPTLLVLAPLTVLLTLLAYVRRARLPDDERMTVPPLTSLFEAAARPFRNHDRSLSESRTFKATSTRGLLLNVLIVVGIVAFVSSIGVAYTFPTDSQQFTELYIVTESDDGEFVLRDYPQQFTVGESKPLYVTVSNHEKEDVTYTLVVELQRIDRTPNGTTVIQETQLTRFSASVSAGETVRFRHELQPPFGGGRLRVQYLLYRGDPPSEPTSENAYMSIHLWITVINEGA